LQSFQEIARLALFDPSSLHGLSRIFFWKQIDPQPLLNQGIIAPIKLDYLLGR
jgi:hypothetical protein